MVDHVSLLKAAALFTLAAILPAQTAAPKPILGTVTEFKVDSLELGVQPDNGAAVFLKFGPATQVVRIPPGERGLEKATPAKVSEIALGDRVMVSFADGMAEARRIVLISSSDIARRNAAQRLDWQKRGISGVVAGKNGNEIALEIRTSQGAHTVTVAITRKTTVRRYAPDSVRFADAILSSAAEIATGDQLRTRGEKSEDGTKVTAEDVVFGTFLTRLGLITAVDRDSKQIKIEELETKRPLTIKLTTDTQFKMMPEVREMFGAMMTAGGGQHGQGSTLDMAKILGALPAARIEDLKIGGTVIVTSTRGAKIDELSAIMLLANADSLIQMAQTMTKEKGANPMDAINKMHGGMLGGPGGVSLPAMIP
jgi:hypothetical protein